VIVFSILHPDIQMVVDTTKNHLLFLTTKSPWTSSSAASCTDMVMTAAIFDQSVRLLFCNDGVYQLLKDQDGTLCGMKTLAKQLTALDLYGIEQVYVEKSALQERGLQERDLLQAVTILSCDQIRTLIADSKAVLVF
jgi:tRNA 2-thiouridine synthesizing protein C